MIRPLVIIEETFNTSAEKVWQALTDKEKMKQWYFDLEAFQPRVGFEFTFVGKGLKGQEYIHQCKVTEAIPNRKLQYSWRYENYPGQSLVTIELFEEGKNTRLRLTHQGLETLPSDDPDFAHENFQAGWTELIKQSLRKYLETIT